MRLLTPDEFRGLSDREAPFARGEAALYRAAAADPEPAESGRIVRYCISNSSVARDGHTIATAGWVLDNYLSNPVFLWAHDSDGLPIGKVVEIGAVGDWLMANVEYAEYDFANTVYQLVRGGYLNATSVSWLPLDWEFSKDRARPGGIDFKRQELLEVSQVPVPSLPTALATARSAGIDTGPLYDWAERVLDSGDKIVMPRADLEEMRRAAKMPKPATRQAAPPRLVRDLYDVSWLAQIVMSLDSLQDCVEWESAYEEDGSPVPGQLKAVLAQLGQILVDMTVEEVAELLADEGGERDASDTPAQRAIRAIAKMTRAVPVREPSAIAPVTLNLAGDRQLIEALIRSGRVLSAENERCLREAHENLTRGCDMVRGLIDLVNDPDADPEPDADDDQQRQLRSRKARALKQKLAPAGAPA